MAAEELAKYQPVGIVTFSERALRLTAFLAEKLNLLFHSISTVTQLTDKFTQRKAFSNAGIESIRFHLINRTDDWEKAVNAVGLPAVLKPSYGGGSINTFFY
ncbi:ATP-grasp domain-containing protein [Photorhabdus temperata]|uniref:ATP-grasp domain-containing protein n=1 Tax=Photorhabdus temperata TaxID=574560 RepID=UPI0004275A26|nr:ATP-grasp domain-containing protein [Photorhabdus temperata]